MAILRCLFCGQDSSFGAPSGADLTFANAKCQNVTLRRRRADSSKWAMTLISRSIDDKQIICCLLR
jgi:ribosomal protein L24E